MLLEEFKFLVEELGKINDDPEPVHDEVPEEQHHEEHVEEKKPTDMRAAIRKAIEPSVAVAKSIIEAIGDSAETTGTSKKMKDQEQQVKNFEKQAKGACEQVISVVEGKHFVPDKHNSSPRAYKIIRHNDSRDVDAVKLSLAIITFYNSLG